jgi:hypothetical protein
MTDASLCELQLNSTFTNNIDLVSKEQSKSQEEQKLNRNSPLEEQNSPTSETKLAVSPFSTALSSLVSLYFVDEGSISQVTVMYKEIPREPHMHRTHSLRIPKHLGQALLHGSYTYVPL